MPKRATPIWLREEERAALMQVTKRRKSGQHLVLRARIVLAAGEGKSNVMIAQELSVSVETVRLWRDRWAAWQDIDLKDRKVEERLTDAPARVRLPTSPQSSAVKWKCWRAKRRASQDDRSVSGVGVKLPRRWCNEASLSASRGGMQRAS
jgi:transposase